MNYTLIEACKEFLSKKPINYWNRSTAFKWYDTNQINSIALAKKHYENGGSIQNRPCL